MDIAAYQCNKASSANKKSRQRLDVKQESLKSVPGGIRVMKMRPGKQLWCALETIESLCQGAHPEL